MLNEPRGGVFRHVNLLVPPKNPAAQMGFIIMEPEDTPPMSGSNCICVATVLLDAGIIPMVEPETQLVLEAPAGLVEVTARCSNGKAQSITLKNVPAFAERLGVPLEVEGLGTITVDTAFGGDSFVMADAKALGFDMTPDEARDLAVIGRKIVKAGNEQLGFTHPDLPDWKHFSFAFMTGPLETRRWRALEPQCLRGEARQDRPLAHRHGLFRADGGAACQGAAEGGPALHRPLHHRKPLHGRDRGQRPWSAITQRSFPPSPGRAWITGQSTLMLDPR